MATVNRYTQLTPARFTPLSLEEVMAVPIYKQQQHEQLQSAGAEMGLFDIQSLEKDRNLANETISSYQEELDNAIDELNIKGFDANTKSKILALNKKKSQMMSEQGKLGQIQKQYNNYVTNAQQQRELYEKGKISRDKYERGLQQALSEYKGVAEGGQYQGFSGIHDTDFVEMGRKIAKDIQDNPKLIEQYLPVKKIGVTWVDTKTGTEYTEPQAIKLAVQNALASDSNVMSDLQQREQLGLLGGRTAFQTIEGLANTFEATYGGVQSQTVDMKRTVDQEALYRLKQADEAAKLKNAFNYEASAARTLNLNYGNIAAVLDGIGSGMGKPTENISVGIPGGGSMSIAKDANQSIQWSIDDMDFTARKEYDAIIDGLKRTNALPEDAAPDSKEARDLVRQYIKQVGDLTFENMRVKEGITKNYGQNVIGAAASNGKKVAQDVLDNAHDRTFYHPKYGVLSYEQMVRKGLLSGDSEEDLKNATSTGYYTGDNYFVDEAGELGQHNEVMFASPIEMRVGENIFLVSRSASELRSPAMRAEVDYNRIFRNTTKRINLPYRYSLPNGQQVDMIYKGKNQYREDVYVAQGLDSNGEYIGEPKDTNKAEMRRWLLGKHGVIEQ